MASNSSAQTAGDYLVTITGQSSLDDAIAWIAEHHDLKAGADSHLALQMIVQGVPESVPLREKAIRRLARENSYSRLDTGAVLFDLSTVVPPDRYRKALDTLVGCCPGRRLDQLNAEALLASQRLDSLTIETVCLIAGLSYRDLKERLADAVPDDGAGPWQLNQVEAVFGVVDAILRGTEVSPFTEAHPARPIEIQFPYLGASRGWLFVEQARRGGVPYEVLLAQRAVGSAWGAHRNRTSSRLNTLLANRLSQELDQRQIAYRRARAAGGKVSKKSIRALVGESGPIGLVIVDSSNHPLAAIALSVARDGGTASKTAGRLRTLTKARVPVFLLLAGPGWAERNETADLAKHFGGRIFAEGSIEDLATALHSLIYPPTTP